MVAHALSLAQRFDIETKNSGVVAWPFPNESARHYDGVVEGDAAQLRAGSIRDAQRVSRVRVLAVVAGVFPALDTAVNIAFPAIDEHFGLDVADLQWIVTTYLFTYGALLIAAGRLGDAIGHRRLVGVGGVVSVVGLAGCAAAPAFGVFLAARVVQGVGTALVLAGAPALLTTSVEAGPGPTAEGPEPAPDSSVARGQAVSWFQAASMIGLAVGPVVGGPIVELAGWRAVYWLRIPIAVALVVIARQVGAPAKRPRTNISKAAQGEWRALVKRPGFVRANVLTAIANAAMFPTWLLVPTLLVDEIGLAVVVAGLVLAASPAASAWGSLWVGRQIGRHGPARLARFGLVAEAGGLALLAWATPDKSLPFIVIAMLLVGLGIGIFSVPNMHVVMSSLPLNRQGVAGGLSLMMRTLGVVAGVVAASALFDRVEANDGFDPALRAVFIASAVLALVGAALSYGSATESDR